MGVTNHLLNGMVLQVDRVNTRYLIVGISKCGGKFIWDDCSLRMKKTHPFPTILVCLVSGERSLPIISSRHGISCSTEAWSYCFRGERWPLKGKISNEVARPMTYSDQIGRVSSFGLFHSIPASFQTWVVLPSSFVLSSKPFKHNTSSHSKGHKKTNKSQITIVGLLWLEKTS